MAPRDQQVRAGVANSARPRLSSVLIGLQL
jgi:hypothetical protein